jgi:hypothetical protein
MMVAANGRARAIGGEAHRVYRAIIDGILADGGVLPEAALADATGLSDKQVRDALDALVAGDWAGRDANGALTTIYPFSALPTAVRLRIAGCEGAERYAMCAIDALGVAPMLGRAVGVASACPVCGTAIGLTVAPDGVRDCDPPALAVLHRRTAGPAHLLRCGATRFVCSPEHGRTWLAAQGGPDDDLLPPDAAFARAHCLFGASYREGRIDE